LKNREETNRMIEESRRDLAEKDHQQREMRKTNFQSERSRNEALKAKLAESNKYAYTQTQSNLNHIRTLHS
jgi:hypothetical protein